MTERGRGCPARRKTEVPGQVPSNSSVSLHREVPSECPKVGRASWVVFQDLRDVQGTLEIGSFRFLAAGPDLNHGLQVTNFDAHRVMLGGVGVWVKE